MQGGGLGGGVNGMQGAGVGGMPGGGMGGMQVLTYYIEKLSF